jgi:hypothetical protein
LTYNDAKISKGETIVCEREREREKESLLRKQKKIKEKETFSLKDNEDFNGDPREPSIESRLHEQFT